MTSTIGVIISPKTTNLCALVSLKNVLDLSFSILSDVKYFANTIVIRKNIAKSKNSMCIDCAYSRPSGKYNHNNVTINNILVNICNDNRPIDKILAER